MRNVYTSFDFGNWIQGGTHDPSIQILSVTDVEKANAEFETLLKARIQSMQQNCGADDSSALCGQNLVLLTAKPPWFQVNTKGDSE